MKDTINISNRSEDSGSEKAIIKTKNDRLERRYILKGKRVGISISECENLVELGFDINHLKDVTIETAKYILSLGGSLAYGGDLRNGGFTELFFDLLNYYNLPDSNQDRFHSYLAWPLHLNLTKNQQADLIDKVTFKKVDPPEDVVIQNLEEFLHPTKGENQYIWSRSLTNMRYTMEKACDARAFLGGKISGFKGKYPGILEEFVVALENSHPIYLIGAFGGVTQEIVKVLEETESILFKDDNLIENDDYQELIKQYDLKLPEQKINYPQLKESIQTLGWEGISNLNGLTIEENKRLAVSPHINEIVYLILTGLTNKFSS